MRNAIASAAHWRAAPPAKRKKGATHSTTNITSSAAWKMGSGARYASHPIGDGIGWPIRKFFT